MDFHFFRPHEGIQGPGVPVPDAAAEVLRRWDGATGDPEAFEAELYAAAPDSSIRFIPPGWEDFDGRVVNEGMVSLQIPAEGYPFHIWWAISFRPAS